MSKPKIFKHVTEDKINISRAIWLAGLGAFSTIEEEGEKMFRNFLQKGKMLEKKGETLEKHTRKKIGELEEQVIEKVKMVSHFQEVAKVIEEKINSTVERVNYSQDEEINKIKDKIDHLAENINTLIKNSDKSLREEKAEMK
ncbi:MAG: phasin family protein [Calditrichia bacterium]